MFEMGRALFTAVLVCCLWSFAVTYNNDGICYYQQKVLKYIKTSVTVPDYHNGAYLGSRVVYRTTARDAYAHVPHCCVGYQVITNYPLQCEPICEPQCVNAECVKPNFCLCREGYFSSRRNVCSPMCRNGCINGKCIAPNRCECNSGFTKNGLNRCIKICQLGCENGICINGECVCNSGYNKVAPNKCIKECKCENGRCTLAGICECNDGYVKDSSFHCVPHCSKGCKNGQCIAPNTCECTTGFEHDKNGECVPRCSPVCTNGICQTPNKCVCNPGYTMTGTEVCGPECSNCTNGLCSDLGTKCTPECAQICINGKCTAPNMCTCDNGYEKDPADDTNSRCIARNEDRCYALDPASRVCVPTCSNNCTHGTCTENGTCSCEEGWTGTSCDTLDLCWKCNRKNTRRCTPNTDGCDCKVDSSAHPCTDRCHLHGDQFQASCSHLAKCSCLSKECFESEGVCYCSSGAVKCESSSTAAASLDKYDSTNLGEIGIILVTLMIFVLIVVPVLQYIRSQYDLRKMERNMDNENCYDVIKGGTRNYNSKQFRKQLLDGVSASVESTLEPRLSVPEAAVSTLRDSVRNPSLLTDAFNQDIGSTMVENELYVKTMSDSEIDTYDQLQYQETLP